MQSGHAKTAACIYSRSSCNMCYNVLNLRLLNYLFLRANHFEAYPRCPETSIHPTGKCWKVQHAMGHWAWTPCKATDLWSVGLEVHHWIVAKPSPFWCLMPLLYFIVFIIYLHISSYIFASNWEWAGPGTSNWSSRNPLMEVMCWDFFPTFSREIPSPHVRAGVSKRKEAIKPPQTWREEAEEGDGLCNEIQFMVTSCHFVCRKIMLCSCRPPGIKLHSHQLLHSWTLFNSERLPGFCGHWYQWSCVTPREETSPCDIVQPMPWSCGWGLGANGCRAWA